MVIEQLSQGWWIWSWESFLSPSLVWPSKPLLCIIALVVCLILCLSDYPAFCRHDGELTQRVDGIDALFHAALHRSARPFLGKGKVMHDKSPPLPHVLFLSTFLFGTTALAREDYKKFCRRYSPFYRPKHPTRLYSLLHADVDPGEGRRLLLPFLTITDLLHLSECSRSLVKYRYYLDHVVLVRHPALEAAEYRRQRQQEQGGGGDGRSIVPYQDWKEREMRAARRCVRFIQMGKTHRWKQDLNRFWLGRGMRGLHYRYYGMQWGILRLLLRQQVGIKHLQLTHRSLLAVMEVVAPAGCLATVEFLDLSCLLLDDKDLACLGKVLLGGGLGSMKVLDMSDPFLGSRERSGCPMFTAQGIGALMGALSRGACPHLECLLLGGNKLEGANAGQAIAGALESNHCQHLTQLDLCFTALGAGQVVAIARAMEGGHCPALRMLDLSACSLSPDDGLALGRALQHSPCCLEVVELNHNPTLMDEGVMAVMEGAQGGNSRLTLQYLTFEGCFMGPEAGSTWVNIFPSMSFHYLGLNAALATPSSTLLTLLEQALVPNVATSLRVMDLTNCQMTSIHGILLSQRLSSGCFPHLQELRLSNNEMIGDGPMSHVFLALSGGCCPGLQLLDIAHVGMRRPSTLALAHALSSGGLSCLHSLTIESSAYLGERAMIKVVNRLGRGMRVLRLCVGGVGKALGSTMNKKLRQGYWPALKELMVRVEDGDWLVELAEVLERGGGDKLEKLELRLPGRLDGLQALERAFGAGACPHLRLLVMVMVGEGGDQEVVRQVAEALSRRASVVVMKEVVVVEGEEQGQQQ